MKAIGKPKKTKVNLSVKVNPEWTKQLAVVRLEIVKLGKIEGLLIK